MSDETTTPETGEQESTESPEQSPRPTETVEFWKSKAREQEKRAKDNADAAKRLAEIENAQKTEAQKATEALEEATQRAAAAESALLRYTVATEQGIPSQAVKFLTGSTREEIEASAKDVLELIGDAGKPRSPKPDPNQGRSGGSAATTADQFAGVVGGLLT